MMTINVFSTSNNVLRVIQTNATNWDGLYTDLSNGTYTSSDGVASYDLSNTSCKVGIVGSGTNGNQPKPKLTCNSPTGGFNYSQ